MSWSKYSHRVGRNVYQNVVSFDSHSVRINVALDRRTKALSRSDIETSGVKRAFNDIILEPTLREKRIFMRTDVACAEPLIPVSIKGQFAAVDCNSNVVSVCEKIDRANLPPIAAHRHSRISRTASRAKQPGCSRS